MKKRLTRHEMVQKDDFISGLEKALRWLEGNWRTVLIGMASVVAAAILVSAAMMYLASRGKAADRLLGEAMSTMRAPILTEGALPPVDGGRTFSSRLERDEAALAGLEAVIDTYPSSRAATISAYLRGTVLLRLDRPDEGREALSAFVGDNPDDPDMVPLARRAMATAEMEAGNPEGAVAILEDLVANPTTLAPVDAALMDLARAQEAAGQIATAVETYRRLANEYPQSLYAGEAGQAVARLGAMTNASVGSAPAS
jgi:tetratricopeptide (TPR) repeat protein